MKEIIPKRIFPSSNLTSAPIQSSLSSRFNISPPIMLAGNDFINTIRYRLHSRQELAFLYRIVFHSYLTHFESDIIPGSIFRHIGGNHGFILGDHIEGLGIKNNFNISLRVSGHDFIDPPDDHLVNKGVLAGDIKDNVVWCGLSTGKMIQEYHDYRAEKNSFHHLKCF